MARLFLMLMFGLLLGTNSAWAIAGGDSLENEKASAENPPHDYHVSITTIEYNKGACTMEVTMKIFTNDLEDALESQGVPQLDLGDENENPKADAYITRYLQERFEVEINGKKFVANFIGKEVDFDATWCYLELSDVPVPTQMRVRHEVLTEYFDDQSNMVHLQIAGHKSSLFLRKGFVSDAVSF